MEEEPHPELGSLLNQLRIVWKDLPGKWLITGLGSLIVFALEIGISYAATGGKTPSWINVILFLRLPIALTICYFAGAVIFVSLRDLAVLKDQSRKTLQDIADTKTIIQERDHELATERNKTTEIEKELAELRHAKLIRAPLVLKQREVQFHTFHENPNLPNNFIAVDAFAMIVLSESFPPPIDHFLDRVRLGKPFCLYCKTSLLQTVFFGAPRLKCVTCGRGKVMGLDIYLKTVHAEIRKDYQKYWNIYRSEILRLTGARPEDYQLG
ncbi:MAG: hypothetical protein JRN15_06725 [Nitrososphaerota archaeon]|nr:hypothetical protein [Nitrososphaerota archaeon]